eukprot:4028954-Heterocapsa_arctica.AAC.1
MWPPIRGWLNGSWLSAAARRLRLPALWPHGCDADLGRRWARRAIPFQRRRLPPAGAPLGLGSSAARCGHGSTQG